MYDQRPIARAILLTFIEELRKHKLSRNYAVRVQFNESQQPYHGFRWDMRVMAAIFPVTRWFKGVEPQANEQEIISVGLNDKTMSVAIKGRQTDPQHKWGELKRELSLCDPTIDLAGTFAKLYHTSFQSTLGWESLNVLDKWVY